MEMHSQELGSHASCFQNVSIGSSKYLTKQLETGITYLGSGMSLFIMVKEVKTASRDHVDGKVWCVQLDLTERFRYKALAININICQGF